MNFNEMKTLIAKRKLKYPFWFEGQCDPKANGDQIISAEKSLGIKFPKEYVEFIMEYGGGDFAFTEIFSVYPNSKWNIVEFNRKCKCLDNGFLVFSDDHAGGYYGFPLEHGICKSQVIYWDHTSEEGNLIETEYENLFDYIVNIGLNG